MWGNKNIETSTIIRWITWGIIAVCLIVFNYWYLNKYLSFNSTYITDYIPPEDKLSGYRKPSVAGIFYSALPLNSVSNMTQAGVFGQYSGYQPKIMVIPQAPKHISADITPQVYGILQKYTQKIHNVILLGATQSKAGNIIYLGDRDYKIAKTILPINREIINDLSTDKIFKIDNSLHQKEQEIRLQLPFIKQMLPQIKVVPLIYGNVSGADIADALEKKIAKEDTLLVVLADMADYHISRTSAAKNGIDAAIILAKKLNYYPQMIELINNQNGNFADVMSQDYESKIFVETENLRNFVSAYGYELREIARLALSKAVKSNKRYLPSRRRFPERVFDKGASYVFLTDGKEIINSSGSILPNTAIAKDIADNIYEAVNEYKNKQKITAKDLSYIGYKIFLLSSFEQINYKTPKDLLAQIHPRLDGLVIRDGNRQGVILPEDWKAHPQKEDFFKQLKIKAGIAPSYWDNQIKVYRFQTVEIKDEN